TTSRDFVPWRFSDACWWCAWMPSSCRRQRNLHNCRPQGDPEQASFQVSSSRSGHAVCLLAPNHVAPPGDLRRVTPWLWLYCERCQHGSPTGRNDPTAGMGWTADAGAGVAQQPCTRACAHRGETALEFCESHRLLLSTLDEIPASLPGGRGCDPDPQVTFSH